MSLNVKKLNPLARIPIETIDGSYELYANNNYIVYPNSNCIVSTGLALSIPTGYNARVYSTSTAESHNIEVSNFCSINHHSYKTTLNQTVQELKVVLRNHGQTEFNVARGDPIARLIIHQIKKLPVYEVDKLDDITQDFSVQMKLRGVKAFPGRVRTWFIMEFKNAPDRCRERYTNATILEELETFKTTEEYKRSRDKMDLEAKFIYNKMEKSEERTGEPAMTLFDRAKNDHNIAKAKASAI